MAFKIPQVPSSILYALGLYSQSFRILNAVESSVALSNYYLKISTINLMQYHIYNEYIFCPSREYRMNNT